jgi:thymidine phosphorylase
VAAQAPAGAPAALSLQRIGIDTYQEPVVYMRRDRPVCVSEGFEAQSRVEVRVRDRSIVATLNVVDAVFLGETQAGLSESAWRMLSPQDGDTATLRHPPPLGRSATCAPRCTGARSRAAGSTR